MATLIRKLHKEGRLSKHTTELWKHLSGMNDLDREVRRSNFVWKGFAVSSALSFLVCIVFPVVGMFLTEVEILPKEGPSDVLLMCLLGLGTFPVIVFALLCSLYASHAKACRELERLAENIRDLFPDDDLEEGWALTIDKKVLWTRAKQKLIDQASVLLVAEDEARQSSKAADVSIIAEQEGVKFNRERRKFNNMHHTFFQFGVAREGWGYYFKEAERPS